MVYLRVFPISNIQVPDSVESIYSSAFAGSTVNTVRIPSSVKNIKDNVFKDSDKTTVISPFDAYAIEYCCKNGVYFELEDTDPK